MANASSPSDRGSAPSRVGVANRASARVTTPDEPDQERWLLSYADLVTLLFAVFAYQTFQLSRMVENTRRPLASPPQVVKPEPPRESLGRAWSEALIPRLTQRLHKHNQDVRIQADPRGVVVILSDSPVLFEVASSRLSASGTQMLRDLLPAALEGAPQLTVVGHADSNPIRDGLYKDNFDLSLARAQSVWRTLIDLGLSPRNIQLLGLGCTVPVADNRTEEGRRKNRRVEIIFRYPEHKSGRDSDAQ